MSQVSQRITLSIGLIAAGFILVLLIWVNTRPAYTLQMQLGVDTPAISHLGPPPRVSGTGKQQYILESPVYFDARSPSWYRQADIVIVFRDQGSEITSMGVQTAEGFNYAVAKPIVSRVLDDGWQELQFSFDITNGYAPRNVKRFLIDVAPTRTVGGKVELRDITVTFRK